MIKINKKQQGQTLIETLAAIFVLAMGITAVVGLATFTLSSSSNVTKQVIGVGLARQGIEAVKNMRDTNWLQQGAPDTDCYNFKNQEGTDSCFRNWLNSSSGYMLAPSPSNSFTLSLVPDPTDETFPNSSDIKFWHLLSPDPTYGYTLFYYPLNSSSIYFYDPFNRAGKQKPSGYYRSITITQESSPTPFDQDGVGPVMRVVSQVWWNDKKCPVASAFAYPSSGSCRITLETLLTNWKTN